MEQVPMVGGVSLSPECLEGISAREILERAVAEYGDRLALSVSFGGAEGMVLLDMLSRVTDEVRVLTIDTGFLFRETVEFREEVERRYRLPVEVLRPALSVEEQVRRYGEGLRGCQPDICCQIRKVEPFERAMQDYDAWMTGIRREQTPTRSRIPIFSWGERFGAAKVSPLAAWTAEDVDEYVRENDVPLNPLLSMGYKSIGCEPQTRPVGEGEDPRAGRWSGSEKTECGLHWAGGRS
ncbi:MAG: phosphoadenylyl-sulfate reductase [Rubrobacter sp.]|nr:phosphoadenylyl-sulfate reductase [Rubrobacter sp.]